MHPQDSLKIELKTQWNKRYVAAVVLSVFALIVKCCSVCFTYLVPSCVAVCAVCSCTEPCLIALSFRAVCFACAAVRCLVSSLVLQCIFVMCAVVLTPVSCPISFRAVLSGVLRSVCS
jgi:hypothetical protein